MRSQKTIRMAEIALMSAVLCVVSPFTIPVPMSPVPLSLSLFAVYLAAVLLGAKRGTICVLIYVLLGMVGLPVFSGFSGGIGVLLGPTGGYIIGYIPCALLTGVLAERKRLVKTEAEQQKRVQRWRKITWNTVAMVLGTLICYACGTAWFLVIMGGTYTLMQALVICVVPYLIFDITKIFAAAAMVLPMQRILRRIEQQ